MFCDEVLELIEPIAAGELAPEERVSSHIASCANCAKVLAEARKLEDLLRGRAIAQPPVQFTNRIMGRIRRERWRREQFLDTGFNVIVGLVALTLLVGVWLLLARSGVVATSREALNLINSTAFDVLRRRIAPSLPLYFAAIALVATALGVWWWAERESA